MPIFMHTFFVFYRAMHFSAKRGIAIACPLVNLGCSLFATPT